MRVAVSARRWRRKLGQTAVHAGVLDLVSGKVGRIARLHAGGRCLGQRSTIDRGGAARFVALRVGIVVEIVAHDGRYFLRHPERMMAPSFWRMTL